MLVSVPISWSRKKQATLYLSLAEAEYRVVVNEVIHEVWIHGILTEFGIHIYPLVYLFCDN